MNNYENKSPVENDYKSMYHDKFLEDGVASDFNIFSIVLFQFLTRNMGYFLYGKYLKELFKNPE